MNRKVASRALLVVGVAGMGWLHVVAFLDDSSFLIAFVGERPAWIACFITFSAMGVVLALPSADRRAGPPVFSSVTA